MFAKICCGKYFRLWEQVRMDFFSSKDDGSCATDGSEKQSFISRCLV